jgi:hypothetical protein
LGKARGRSDGATDLRDEVTKGLKTSPAPRLRLDVQPGTSLTL